MRKADDMQKGLNEREEGNGEQQLGGWSHSPPKMRA